MPCPTLGLISTSPRLGLQRPPAGPGALGTLPFFISEITEPSYRPWPPGPTKLLINIHGASASKDSAVVVNSPQPVARLGAAAEAEAQRQLRKCRKSASASALPARGASARSAPSPSSTTASARSLCRLPLARCISRFRSALDAPAPHARAGRATGLSPAARKDTSAAAAPRPSAPALRLPALSSRSPLPQLARSRSLSSAEGIAAAAGMVRWSSIHCLSDWSAHINDQGRGWAACTRGRCPAASPPPAAAAAASATAAA